MKRIKKYLVVVFSAAMLTLLGTVVIEAAPGSLNEIVTQFGRNNPGSAVVVSNLTDNSEARLNGGTSFTSASLYKLFVAEYLFKEREAGNLRFNQSFVLKDVAEQHEENVSDCNGNQACVNAIWPSIPTGQSATVAECLNKMVIYSDNICGKTFLDEARKKYSKVPGYTGTFFSPLRTNANDVAKLMSDIAKETWLSKGASQEMYALLKQQYHKEKIPAGLPPGTEFGNKTGEIHSVSNGKSHDAAIVKAGDKTYVLVVLTNKNPDLATTKQRIAGLSKQVYEFIAQGVASDDPANSTCAPEASAESAQGAAANSNINDILLELEAPLYDPDGPACCDASLGGPSDGGPLTGVRFPALDDTAALSAAIKEYIQKGWPSSPLIPFADDFVRFGQQYDINPTIPVVIAQVEYQFGTVRTDLVGPGGPGQYNFWAVTHNSNASTRFGPYPSIIVAMEEHYKLLSGRLYLGPPSNFTTISQIMNRYAPSVENDTPRYIRTIEDGVRKLLGDAGVSGGGGASADTPASATGDDSGCGSASAIGGLVPILHTKPPGGSYGYADAEGQPNSSGQKFHMAIDWFAPANSPVKAPASGKIARLSPDPNPGQKATGQVFGGTISVRDTEGRLWTLRHISPSDTISEGQTVNAGDVIGGVKDWAGPTHIHLELYGPGSDDREYSVEKAINPIQAYQAVGLLTDVECRQCN